MIVMADSCRMVQIDTGYACFGLQICGGIVTIAAPIANWTVGKKWEYVKSYYINKKKAKITEL